MKKCSNKFNATPRIANTTTMNSWGMCCNVLEQNVASNMLFLGNQLELSIIPDGTTTYLFIRRVR